VPSKKLYGRPRSANFMANFNSDTATEEQVLELLRHRFGHINQTERFRAEMSMRKRKPGESVQ